MDKWFDYFRTNKWFNYFLVMEAIIIFLLIFLHRSIKTISDVFAFMFFAFLVIAICCFTVLELMILESFTNWIVELSNQSQLYSRIVLLVISLSILIIIPIQIYEGARSLSEEQKDSSYSNCLQVFGNLTKSQKAIYDADLLSKCKYTKPLTEIIPTETNTLEKSSQNWPHVFQQYLEYFAKNTSFAVSFLLAAIGGTSYTALALLVIKKGWILLVSLFSSSVFDVVTSPQRSKRRWED